MRREELVRRNVEAKKRVSEYRRQKKSLHNPHSKEFHQYKNSWPYFGLVDVSVEGLEVTMFSANDDLIAMTYFWNGDSSFEPMSLKMWVKKSNRAECILDVGAHSGVYSLISAACAKINGSQKKTIIHAFEPVRRTYSRLIMNVRMNQFHPMIECHNCGISSENKEVKIKQFRGENILGAGASIADKNIPIIEETEIVSIIKLDDFVASNKAKPDLIKIDIEGEEINGLKGMLNTIELFRPEIFIEVTAETISYVVKTLFEYDYCINIIDDSSMKLIEIKHKDISINSYKNLLCSPK